MPRTEIEPRERGGGRWWLWLVIILTVLFFIWIFAWRPGYNTAGVPATGTASRTEINSGQSVSAANLPALVGKHVQLLGVTVARVVNGHAFWVGRAGQEVLVIVNQPASANVTSGQIVNITGKVDTLPSLTQARQQWNLDPADIQQLQRQQVYLEANRVEIRKQ